MVAVGIKEKSTHIICEIGFRKYFGDKLSIGLLEVNRGFAFGSSTHKNIFKMVAIDIPYSQGWPACECRCGKSA
jgi:hypothetical protein